MHKGPAQRRTRVGVIARFDGIGTHGPRNETLEILLDPESSTVIEEGRLVLPQADAPRLQIVSDPLGKSVLLAE
ncbi:hypothetical protein [Thioflavicoccus mobilis]|uniref:hypothetical protein n=1 Tax=Thioflavicoccus mobilis TaxID=80679 RepID=UPI0002D93554|nr:hypothetical protein [Thioflavicoccus mobilis]